MVNILEEKLHPRCKTSFLQLQHYGKNPIMQAVPGNLWKNRNVSNAAAVVHDLK